MGIFNEIGKKTSEATKKITMSTKLKFEINDGKNKISDLYEEIGKKVYQSHINEEGISIKDDLQEECEKIDSISKEIEIARKKILKLNNKKQCPKCYAEIEKDALFCSKCGHKLENVDIAKKEEVSTPKETNENKIEDETETNNEE